jgi:hypothetical protein
VKTASFTVRATERQSLRWKRAADLAGHRAVGTWAAEALDKHLDAVARAGRPIPLGWRRRGVFAVQLASGEARISGSVSVPFAYYRGTDAGADRYSDFFTLVLTTSGRIIATLRSAAQCRALASDLAREWIRHGGEEPETRAGPIVERHVREAM